MDRLSSLEYSLMRDIYDDYSEYDDYAEESYDGYDDYEYDNRYDERHYDNDEDYALEGYDDYDDDYDGYASRYDGYDYDDYDEAFEGSREPKPGSFGQYMGVTRRSYTNKKGKARSRIKGKIAAFFRAVLRRIGTFFLKLGQRIKMLFDRKNKAAYQAKIRDIETNNAVMNAAGRLSDIFKNIKRPTIKSLEAIRKLDRAGGYGKSIEVYENVQRLVETATDEVKASTDNIKALKAFISDRGSRIGRRISYSTVLAACYDRYNSSVRDLEKTFLTVSEEYKKLSDSGRFVHEEIYYQWYTDGENSGDMEIYNDLPHRGSGQYQYQTVQRRRGENKGETARISELVNGITVRLRQLIDAYSVFATESEIGKASDYNHAEKSASHPYS